MVPKSGRFTTCIRCKDKKKKCSVKGIVNKLVASGKLGTPGESTSLKISSKEDVIALGLGTAGELIMLQLVSFRQEMNERLGAIEARLDTMEARWGAKGEGEDSDGSSDPGSGDTDNDGDEYSSENGGEGGLGEVEMSE